MTLPVPDGFKWSKFFSGLFNPLNFAKSFVFLVQAGIIILVIISLVVMGMAIKQKFLKPKKTSPSITVTGNSGGSVHSSQDENIKKFGLVNLL
jgi:hypothetical protein